MSDDKDLRAAVAAALQASDAETAWYFDRVKLRVVSVKYGAVSDPLLRARDVEDDEIRFIAVPAVTAGEIHLWMEAFVDDPSNEGNAVVGASLDSKTGANARFEERLAKRAPEALTAWHRYRQARMFEAADAWIAGALTQPTPGDGIGFVTDDLDDH
ncbi:MAG: hypothetical protein K8T90_13545 [Planctomycetes bacterium]|nr:hypothetical protein [Planctomycetota bacterium]